MIDAIAATSRRFSLLLSWPTAMLSYQAIMPVPEISSSARAIFSVGDVAPQPSMADMYQRPMYSPPNKEPELDAEH
jgi:hypothetical protein